MVILLSEWVSDFCCKPSEKLFSHIERQQVLFLWEEYYGDVRFVLDQHAKLYRDSSLKQYSADRPLAQLRYTILIPSQPTSLWSYSLMMRA